MPCDVTVDAGHVLSKVSELLGTKRPSQLDSPGLAFVLNNDSGTPNSGSVFHSAKSQASPHDKFNETTIKDALEHFSGLVRTVVRNIDGLNLSVFSEDPDMAASSSIENLQAREDGWRLHNTVLDAKKRIHRALESFSTELGVTVENLDSEKEEREKSRLCGSLVNGLRPLKQSRGGCHGRLPNLALPGLDDDPTQAFQKKALAHYVPVVEIMIALMDILVAGLLVNDDRPFLQKMKEGLGECFQVASKANDIELNMPGTLAVTPQPVDVTVNPAHSLNGKSADQTSYAEDITAFLEGELGFASASGITEPSAPPLPGWSHLKQSSEMSIDKTNGRRFSIFLVILSLFCQFEGIFLEQDTDFKIIQSSQKHGRIGLTFDPCFFRDEEVLLQLEKCLVFDEHGLRRGLHANETSSHAIRLGF